MVGWIQGHCCQFWDFCRRAFELLHSRQLGFVVGCHLSFHTATMQPVWTMYSLTGRPGLLFVCGMRYCVALLRLLLLCMPRGGGGMWADRPSVVYLLMQSSGGFAPSRGLHMVGVAGLGKRMSCRAPVSSKVLSASLLSKLLCHGPWDM